MSLHEVTPEKIQSWKTRFLSEAARYRRRQAVTTVNKPSPHAKALFSVKLRPFLERELDLPAPLLFYGVAMEEPPSQRYRTVVALTPKTSCPGRVRLSQTQEPEAYKIFTPGCDMRTADF